MGLEFGRKRSELSTEEQRLRDAEKNIHKDTEKIRDENARLRAFLDQSRGKTSGLDSKMEEAVEEKVARERTESLDRIMQAEKEREKIAQQTDQRRAQEIKRYLNTGLASEHVSIRKAETDSITVRKEETGIKASPTSSTSQNIAPNNSEDNSQISFPQKKSRSLSSTEEQRLRDAEKNIHKDTEKIRNVNAGLTAFLAVNKLFGVEAAKKFANDQREWEQGKNPGDIPAEETIAWSKAKIAEIAKNLQDRVDTYLETGVLNDE